MDDSVFHRLYEQYHQDIFNFLIYLTGDRTQSEDLMHEVYIRVLRAYSGFEGKSSEKTWLFSIAKNVAIDHFRKKSVRQKHHFDKFDWEQSELVSSGSTPEELLSLNEDMKQLLSVLNTCTGDQKMVIVLRYFQELSIAETAETLGWTEGKVKTTQHRAIKALQKKMNALSEEGGS
ncbi:RNA polymerase sigma factor SigX [Sporosarcina thermotolerans]|uniref:RNA polymerase sigma factor SigX n=1 Tax=Sporosarcina thermotolerans TaxID=633404 RepID=A0AAW9A7H4_9BACL|nr:RNA polymerase sigma factor SigX [Sporosarcina thermotolerans]MDW0115596.1 RNA polymerase sigma factor SigX [Sporosarcina thermotolerans]WHT47104.1 RNA polymerase sigma factor SigX [Sporosarcina thermotolerans]